MKYKSYITQLKQRFLKKKPALRDPQLMHPDREWAIGLFVAVLIFSVCGLWSIHSYLKNRAATALPIEDSSGKTVYRESVVKEALQKMDERKQTFERLTDTANILPVVIEDAATTTPDTIEEPAPADEPLPDTEVPILGD